jgi:hypothetical protein
MEDRMLRRHRLIWLGVVTAGAFWLLEAAIHSWGFGEGAAWTDNLLPGTANEWWMRVLVGLLFIALGVYADRSSHALLRAEKERRVVQARLDDALTRVLTDFLPICAHCKAIREGERWVPVEAYVTEHTQTLFSHGLCPKCLPLYAGT